MTTEDVVYIIQNDIFTHQNLGSPAGESSMLTATLHMLYKKKPVDSVRLEFFYLLCKNQFIALYIIFTPRYPV